MTHLEPCREIEKELTVDTEYLDMMGRDMMCAYQPGIHGRSNRGFFFSPWIPVISFTI